MNSNRTTPLTKAQAAWVESEGYFNAGGTRYLGVEFNCHVLENPSSRQVEWLNERHPFILKARQSV